jgi:hypothetical protein
MLEGKNNLDNFDLNFFVVNTFSKNEKVFLAPLTLNDMFTHFKQLRYIDFCTLTKLSVILPHEVCKLTTFRNLEKNC